MKFEYESFKNLPHLMIGSRAFGVNKDNSDYDIVMMFDDVPQEFTKDLDTGDYSLERYFNLIPPHKAYFLDRRTNLNLIILTANGDMLIIKEVMAELQQMPSYYLTNKQDRINLFETGLLHYGFKSYEPKESNEIPY